VDEVVGDVVVTAPVNAPVTASCNNVSVLSDESSADCAGADQDNGQDPVDPVDPVDRSG
jgi:hypothetical protein